MHRILRELLHLPAERDHDAYPDLLRPLNAITYATSHDFREHWNNTIAGESTREIYQEHSYFRWQLESDEDLCEALQMNRYRGMCQGSAPFRGGPDVMGRNGTRHRD